MIIIAYVKDRKPLFYLKNCGPVALIFKDKGGLANHPFSCHLQEVFGSRESGRNGEKIREKKSSGKTPAKKLSLISSKKMRMFVQDFS